MNCPACSRSLTERTSGALTVDICEGGCGGIFFDNFEVAQVDERAEAEGSALLAWAASAPDTPGTRLERTSCPRCQMIMMRHQFKPGIKVTVDTCPKCNGVWLDRGELAAVRDAPGTDAERRSEAQRFIHAAFESIREAHAPDPD